MHKVLVVIPNWNGAEDLRACLDSVRQQTLKPYVVVVDNGSIDGSVNIVEQEYPEVLLIKHTYNKGYAGGVNPGFAKAIELRMIYVAPFNNDAIADRNWLSGLVNYLDKHPSVGIAASKIVGINGGRLDSTGEEYSVWGLPYPRGRGESEVNKYDQATDILGASGGCSMYRVSMLKEIGLLDEDFFAYYEDVDISLRAQLSGWKVAYVPNSVVYHQINATSKKIKGFTTLQTIKNYPLLLLKNIPAPLLRRVAPRFFLAYFLLIGRGIERGNGRWVLQGLFMTCRLMPKKLLERRRIQSKRVVGLEYIWGMMTHDLPPNAHNLRRLRQIWWNIRGKR